MIVPAGSDRLTHSARRVKESQPRALLLKILTRGASSRGSVCSHRPCALRADCRRSLLSATALSPTPKKDLQSGSSLRLTGRLTEVAQRYQRILTKDARNPEALVGMSLIALASRQAAAA